MLLQVSQNRAIEIQIRAYPHSPLWIASPHELCIVRTAVLEALEKVIDTQAIVAELFIKHYLNDVTPWSERLISLFDTWCLQTPSNCLVLWETTCINPLITEQIITQRYEYNMKSLGRGLTIAGGLPIESYDRFVLQAALHRDAERRQYFFEVATDFQRLVVPSSLTWKPSEAVLEQIFAAALHDSSASVRERAIVYAYGLGWVQRLSGELLRLSSDPVEAVRQYALVALGVADDDESLFVLFAALDGDRKQEMQSAIWALARRPQGLSRLLTMAGDTRPWVVDDILGAIKQVSLPLTDEQLDEVRARIVVPRDEIQFERVFKHHRWRTRDPEGKELPPDRIMRYEMKGAM